MSLDMYQSQLLSRSQIQQIGVFAWCVQDKMQRSNDAYISFHTTIHSHRLGGCWRKLCSPQATAAPHCCRGESPCAVLQPEISVYGLTDTCMQA